MPARTYELRRQVLRPHQRVEEMGWLDLDDPDAEVVGAVMASGEMVGTGAVMPEPPPARGGLDPPPGVRTWRLRAMATRADARGGGVGRAVLDRLLDHVAGRGGGFVWCSARVPAVAFYERAGFVAVGEVFVVEGIGPHVHMWHVVDPSGTAPRGCEGR